VKYRDWYEVVGEKPEVDSTDKVKHNENNDDLLVKTMMEVDERVTTDEE